MSYKILIADDEPEIRSLLRLYLENEKYEIIEAEDGQQALELLRSRQPALCILDIMMPKMDGYHVLQELRKESNIPVLILSAKDADSEKILGLDPEACVLKKDGKVIELTSVEYRIMELFMQQPGKVFTKQQIYEHGWGETYIVADNNIMVCISKLRGKLDEDPSAYIRTIRGLGYRLEK